MLPDPTRICTKCRKELPITAFGKHRLCTGGINPECKQCVCERAKKWGREHPERTLLRARENYRLHREKYIKAKREKYAANKEQDNLRRAQYRAEHLEQERSRMAEWYRANKDKFRIYFHRRRDRKRQVSEQFYLSDVRDVYKNFGGKCVNCGATASLQIDHHYPLFSGHALTPVNAVLLCRTCNARKGRKMPEQFYAEEKLQEIESILFQGRMAAGWR